MNVPCKQCGKPMERINLTMPPDRCDECRNIARRTKARAGGRPRKVDPRWKWAIEKIQASQ